MALPHSKLTAQGQISVPSEVRRKLGIGPGSLLEWDQRGADVIVRRVGTYTSEDIRRALFPKRPRRRSLAELKKALERHARKKHASR
jgi:AbrB family looped-hinge helix DNA binding protein